MLSWHMVESLPSPARVQRFATKTARRRARALLALGVALAGRGVLAKLAMGIAALTVLGVTAAALALTFIIRFEDERLTARLDGLPSILGGFGMRHIWTFI